MLAGLRELTIRHAIATDNRSLLERLEKAGDNLSNPSRCSFVIINRFFVLTQNKGVETLLDLYSEFF
ncbi:MAG: hypothetical protein QM652_01625 [Legionella sp.]|uniref:hypothetical protein n=1 Tax=Legionella sp. TaxID=459 RepID=UPI0039E7228F